MHKMTWLAGVLLGLCGQAWAGQGEVCLSDSQVTPAGIMKPFNDATVFHCKTTGAVTVAQIYAKGWRVVSVFPQSSLDPSKPGLGSTVWTIVAEKEEH